MKRLVCLLALCCIMRTGVAGRSCAPAMLEPEQVQAASLAAQRTYAALQSCPSDLALVARVGQDLSRHGLHYSHVGLALREHPAGPWTVVHLLNSCGTDRSAIYAEGLLDFFLDGIVRYDSRIIWLQPELEQPLLAGLQQGWATHVHDPRYNVIARPQSTRNQNSTGWALDLLGLALDSRRVDASSGINVAFDHGFEPSAIRVSYGKRILGGLFTANADFTDHPVTSRLRGDYNVITVRSIFEWLRRADLVRDEWSSPGAPRGD